MAIRHYVIYSRQLVEEFGNIVAWEKEDEVVTTLINRLSPIFEKVSELQKEIEENDELDNEDFSNFVLSYKDGDKIINEELSFQPIEEWTFYKWVTLETFLSKGLNLRTIDDEGNEHIEQIVKGDRYVLPLLYDEVGVGFDEDLKKLDKKLNFFNKETSFVTTYKIFIRILHLINKVKKLHSFIYGGSSVSKGNHPNMDKHSQDFGWVSTMVDIAEKGVFGTYNEVKNSNLIQVLEYLNCSCSKNSAEANDAELKQNK